MTLKIRHALYCLVWIVGVAFEIPAFALEPEEKIYVAVEGEGTVAVFDAASRQRIRLIDLAAEHDGMRVAAAPHNVQVAPDGRTVWVTVNHGHQGHGKQTQESGHGNMQHAMPEIPADEVVVIDAATDTLIQRIPLVAGLHLAHVVLTPDSASAYITAQNDSALYKINARSYEVEGKVAVPPGSQPHGLRISPDGSRAYIALLQGNALGILNLQTGGLDAVPLRGAAVQTAVTPDGRMALVSLYDTKQLAVYDTASKAVSYIELFKTSRGPVQLYPTPDNRYVYVADQGHYFNQPDSEWVFKVDLQQGRVVWSIKAGAAPHGIAISKDGQFAYITNLVSDDLSVIDLKTDQEVARLPVGHEPNGVSIWNARSGGTP